MLNQEENRQEEDADATETVETEGTDTASQDDADVDPTGEADTEENAEESETVDNAGEEGEGDGAEEDETEAEPDTELTDEEKALIDKLSPKIQKRFDASTQEKLELQKRIKELEANAGAGKKDRTLAEYSEDELYELKKQNPAYEKYVDKELIKREAKKIVEESQSKTSAVTQAEV
jgi:hypothetical protein